jgi:hypothetical protein
MREIRLYGSEGGGAARSPYPYQVGLDLPPKVRQTVKMQNSANGGMHHGFVSEAV